MLVGGEILTVASYGVRIRRLVEKLGLAQCVIFTGFQDNMPAIYDACDLVVLPSLGEAFPRVVPEAMARRRPVIATDCGGPSEIVGDNECGLLVPPGNPAALAQAILRIVEDEELRCRLAEAGRRRVEADFTTERMVRENQHIYQELLNGWK